MFFKFPEILLIISSEKEKFLVLAVFRKTFFIGKKSNFNFQNRGYFVKKIFRKCVQTSVINSFGRDNSPYFAKKFQKYFEVEKNPTSIFKIVDFLEKKNQNPTM